jgi:FkbM family methyltransferase
MDNKKLFEIEKDLMNLLITLEQDVDNSQILDSIVEMIIINNITVEDTIDILKLTICYTPIDDMLNNIGISFWNAGYYEHVLPFLQESFVVNSKNQNTLYNIGYLLDILGESSLALSYLDMITNKSEEVQSLIREIHHKVNPSFFKEYNVKLVNVTNISNPICVRMDTTDPYVFQQIFQQYGYQLPKLPFSPSLIVDGGANVGYSSIWFANLFPEAKIIAVEPEGSNLEVLKYNTMPYKHVEILNSGLWNRNTFLNIKDVGLGKWGIMVEETDKPNLTSLMAVTIDSILDNSGFSEIDILKLDIEGAEKELFSSGYEKWLDKVKIIIIELHDRMKKGCSNSFFSAISKYNFAFTMRGENLILIKEKYYYQMEV